MPGDSLCGSTHLFCFESMLFIWMNTGIKRSTFNPGIINRISLSSTAWCSKPTQTHEMHGGLERWISRSTRQTPDMLAQQLITCYLVSRHILNLIGKLDSFDIGSMEISIPNSSWVTMAVIQPTRWLTIVKPKGPMRNSGIMSLGRQHQEIISCGMNTSVWG